jgi:MFS family permease
VLGFFTCGFQLQFITVHMPSYLVDRGLSAQVGGWTIATIGLFNIIGSVTAGWLGDRMPKRYLLSFIYFVRAAAILAFISFPVTTVSCLIFAAIMGLMWLSTVPPTNGIIALHQMAGDLGGLRLLQPPGRRLPRRLAWRHRVRPHRLVQRGVVARDPVRRALGADQPADRREAG